FHGTPKDFFDLVADSRRAETGNGSGSGGSSLRVASIDMGGGTTDLMILRHDIAPGTQEVIKPQQVFREGFRLAGDDILKELVENCLLPQLSRHLAGLGVARPEAILADLFGGDVEAMSQRDRTLRGQLVAQIFARAAIGLLRRYEQGETDPAVLGDLLAGVEVIARPAIAHFEAAVQQRGGVACDLLAMPVTMNMDEIERLIEGLVGPMVRDLCDLVRAYDCDILLLSGRPSQYAVIRRLILSSMPVPANRIIPMGSYRVGNWYPFRSSDFRIFDPKTTAVVGAMLCHTCSQSVGNMTLKTDGMKMKSTARFIGAMSENGQITAENVLLDNVDLDTGRGVDEFQLKLASPTFIGFRQLPIPRWRASPLYFVSFARPENLRKVSLPLTVTFVRAEPAEGREQQAMEDFSVDDVVDAGGEPLGRAAVKYRLQTMQIENQTEAGYWLDTGVLQVKLG
ncbi:MAG: virulence factor SrfB, partial [Mangrovicoccus sp.]|nr:virulence factor SrfB [Mangrovicoccus sp.]